MIDRATKIAHSLIRVNKLTPPININQLIAQYAYVEYEYGLPFEFDGICFFNGEDKPNIMINGDIPISRQKFTLAHELGHILIPGHKSIIACNVEPVDNNLNTDDDLDEQRWEYFEKEREANTFASELLLPAKWTIDIIKESNDNFQIILEKINDQTGLSIQAITIKAIKYLKPGIVISIEYQNEGNPFFVSSSGTNLHKFNINYYQLNNERMKIEANAKNISEFNFNNYIIKVYDFYDDVILNSNVEVPDMKSTDILIGFLKDQYGDHKGRNLFRTINGIVSAINSRERISSMTREKYYRIVSNRFRNRDPVIKEIVETEFFHQYIAKRYEELSKINTGNES